MKEDNREEGRSSTNVFVKFLPQEVDDACLLELFAPFGRIESAKVMVDPHTWHTLGFGFVKYSRREEALLAIEEMAGYRIGNKTLMCKLSSSATSPASCNIYIKPLPTSFSEDTLRDMFIEYGAINTLKIVRDPNQNDVIGLHVDSAVNAINRTHGTVLLPNWPPLTVKYAESDTQRVTRKANISPPIPKRQLVNYIQSTNPVAENRFGSPDPSCVCPVNVGYLCNCCQQPLTITPVPQGYPVYIPVLHGSLHPPPLPQQTGWYNPYSNVVYPSYASPKYVESS